MSPSSIFPYSLTISIPLPTARLASAAVRSLRVDKELSPLVQREFSIEEKTPSEKQSAGSGIERREEDNKTVVCATYSATTNRMLRVAVNGFLESLGVVLGVMEELDGDVLAAAAAAAIKS